MPARSRLPRGNPKRQVVRLKVSPSDLRVADLRLGFQEGLRKTSNKHLVEYAHTPESVTNKDVLALVLKQEAKKEIERRNALIDKWGVAQEESELAEKLDDVLELVEKGTSPVYHFWKGVAEGQFADELIKVLKYQEKFADRLIGQFEEKTGRELPDRPITEIIREKLKKKK